MKKCLVLHGSPRKGNTYKATQMVMAELARRPGWEFEEIHIRDLRLPFCRGCFSCILRDEELCPHHAVMGSLVEKMMQADALIVGAPIYILQINAETKNLFEHLAYAFHRPRFIGKQAFVITTTAAAAAKKGTCFLKETLYQIGYNHAYELPIACWDAEYKPKDKDLKSIAKLASRFAADVESGRIYTPSWYHIIYHTAFRAAAWAGTKERSADHLYWKEQGLLDKVYPHPSGFVKGLFARAMFAIMRALMP